MNLTYLPYRLGILLYRQVLRQKGIRLLSIALIFMIGLGFLAQSPRTAYADEVLNVNNFNDTHCSGFRSQQDPNCSAPTGDDGLMSLRSALEYASTIGGSSTINLPGWIYDLSLGDLVAGTKANTNISIIGENRNTTFIHQRFSNYRVFIININTQANVMFTLENARVYGGKVNYSDPDLNKAFGGAILAGGSADATGNSLTINNVEFTDNHAFGDISGGVIGMIGGGDLSITDCSFHENDAGLDGNGSGGAIYYDSTSSAGSVLITNTNFMSNSVLGPNSLGGAIYLAGGPDVNFRINNNYFTGNTTSSRGGAIYLSSGYLVGIMNRITGNTATDAGGGIYVADMTGTHAEMLNNWWGSNEGPAGTIYDTTFPAVSSDVPLSDGQIAYDPWIIFKNTSNPGTINAGQSTVMTASFHQNSLNESLATENFTAFTGLGVTWSDEIHGTLSSKQMTVQSDGTASATFTHDGTCDNGSGTATVNFHQAGEASANATVTIRCPDLTIDLKNNVGGSATLESGWTWSFRLSNSGLGSSTFLDGDKVLLDNLPGSHLTYNVIVISYGSGVEGEINCNIDVNSDLSCIAVGAMKLDPGEYIDLAIPVIPDQTGLYTNPDEGGTCVVDPDNKIMESNEANNECNDSVNVNAPPIITSLDSTTFIVGALGTFTVITTPGFPVDTTITETGKLPASIFFTDNGDGSATLSGIPNPGTGGIYPITITASNGIGIDTSQKFTLFVNQAPAITSQNQATFIETQNGTFTITVTEYPDANSITIIDSGDLPSDVTFVDNNNGTATLAGIPKLGEIGDYQVTITASNGVGPDATQAFTLTVLPILTITSPDHVTFTAGTFNSFSIVTYGSLIPDVTISGDLPGGLTFSDQHDGTAIISGTPVSKSGGTSILNLHAHNGVSTDATQEFILTIIESPEITSTDQAIFSAGNNGSFTINTTGYPKGASMKISASGDLPSGIFFKDNGDSTASLSGSPNAGSGGQYSFNIYADNGVNPIASQLFKLFVNEAPTITSSDHDTGTVGLPFGITVTTKGYPKPSLSEVGNLPNGISFKDNGDGTGSLDGMPLVGSGGIYGINIDANNGVDPNGSQTFSLTINETPEITSNDNITFITGINNVFHITTGGFPKPSLSELGILPSGITFIDNGNGTATLSGIPPVGSSGVYSLTFIAHNDVIEDRTQYFTLSVNDSLSFTSNDSISFTVNTFSSYVVSVSGIPVPSIYEDGTMPNGVSFTDNHNGTATLSGIPVLDSVGDYHLTFTAKNGISPDITQNFILIVSKATSIIQIDLSPNTTVYGEPVMITTSVSSEVGSPTGTVQFKIDGSNYGSPISLSDGQATLQTSALIVGMHTFDAFYSGDANFNTAVSVSSQLQVSKASTSLSITIDFNLITFRMPIIPKAVVTVVSPGSGKPTGTVTFYDNGTEIGTGTLDAKGEVVLDPILFATGDHSIIAVYNGDSNYQSDSQTVDFFIPWRILLPIIKNDYKP